MYLHDTEAEILVNGKPVKKFSHKGKTYIQANKGSQYSVRIKNNSPNRRMFVVSVDGINVVNGKPAGSSPFGYVLNGYSSYEVVGFRTSNEEVHPFKFNEKEKSYAAKSEETGGDVSNCGVIGVKVYDEKEKPAPAPQVIWREIVREKEVPVYPPWRPYRPNYPYWGDIIVSDNTNSAVGANSTYTLNSSLSRSSKGMSSGGDSGMLRCCNFVSHAAPTASTPSDEGTTVCDFYDAGTEFSKNSVTDVVSDTEFDIGKGVASFVFYYAFREGLIALGVPITKEVKVAAPNPFPGKFCKPPKD